MNRALLDPFQRSELPETIEDYVEEGRATCMTFNRQGNILAVGTMLGRLVLWDFETRSVWKVLEVHRDGYSITSVSFPYPRKGPIILTAGMDGWLRLTDCKTGATVRSLELGGPVVQAVAHPKKPWLAVATIAGGMPRLIDMEREASSLEDLEKQGAVWMLRTPSDDTTMVSNGTEGKRSKPQDYAVALDRRGQYVVRGGAGQVAVFSLGSGSGVEYLGMIELPNKATAKAVSFSRRGDRFLVNSSDRHITVFSSSVLSSDLFKSQPSFVGRYTDLVSRAQWRCACFSGDSEFLLGGLQSTDHKVYIWRLLDGQLEKTLEGPKEGIAGLAWHPRWPVIVSIGSSYGGIYIWAKNFTENWSAFAPDFCELEENEEYREREDEFDIMDPEDEKKKRENQARSELENEIDVVGESLVDFANSSDSEPDNVYFFLESVPIKDEVKIATEQGSTTRRRRAGGRRRERMEAAAIAARVCTETSDQNADPQLNFADGQPGRPDADDTITGSTPMTGVTQPSTT